MSSLVNVKNEKTRKQQFINNLVTAGIPLAITGVLWTMHKRKILSQTDATPSITFQNMPANPSNLSEQTCSDLKQKLKFNINIPKNVITVLRTIATEILIHYDSHVQKAKQQQIFECLEAPFQNLWQDLANSIFNKNIEQENKVINDYMKTNNHRPPLTAEKDAHATTTQIDTATNLNAEPSQIPPVLPQQPSSTKTAIDSDNTTKTVKAWTELAIAFVPYPPSLRQKIQKDMYETLKTPPEKEKWQQISTEIFSQFPYDNTKKTITHLPERTIVKPSEQPVRKKQEQNLSGQLHTSTVTIPVLNPIALTPSPPVVNQTASHATTSARPPLPLPPPAALPPPPPVTFSNDERDTLERLDRQRKTLTEVTNRSERIANETASAFERTHKKFENLLPESTTEKPNVLMRLDNAKKEGLRAENERRAALQQEVAKYAETEMYLAPAPLQDEEQLSENGDNKNDENDENEVKQADELNDTASNEKPPSGDKYYTLAELQAMTTLDGIDQSQKEMYLNDADFLKTFSKTKEQFREAASHAQKRLKRQKKLLDPNDES